jgi:hypothetical protein
MPIHSIKTFIELRKEPSEPVFPAFYGFSKRLSELAEVPSKWIAILESARGIYLLTCPTTREIYVGAAYGKNGFWERWQDYVATVHGGNIALQGRPPSDFQVSILEQVGNLKSTEEILTKERRWKERLLSREFGLNKN